MTQGLLVLHLNKFKLAKLSVHNPTAANILKLKNYRNLYNTILRKGKKDFFSKSNYLKINQT